MIAITMPMSSLAGLIVWVGVAKAVCEHCHLQNRTHKSFSTPTSFPADLKYCGQYQDASCCTSEVAMKPVLTSPILLTCWLGVVRGVREPGGSFDYQRCGPLSPKCLDFFINEECFYECDVNIGKFRRYENCEQFLRSGSLEVKDVPIKASYCNEWYEACKDDTICAGPNGSIFEDQCFLDDFSEFCKTVSEHFSSDPAEFCNKTFGDAFFYEPNENNAYTMWFAKGAANPNDWVLPWKDYPPRCDFHTEEDTASVCAAALSPAKQDSYKGVAVAAIVLSCITMALSIVMFGFVCNVPGCSKRKSFAPVG